MHSHAPLTRAAKHLFRHLHDENALRDNPLVRRFFDHNSGSVGSGCSGLNEIHRLVREGAEHCRAADLISGNDERAFRQHAIITLQCLEQRPIREVAAVLGISYRHCYRERADICRRVARYICELRKAQTLDHFWELDEFQLLANATLRRAELCDRNVAFRECDRLTHIANSPDQRIEALRINALVCLSFGDVGRAKATYSAAQSIFSGHLCADKAALPEVADARINLMGAKIADYLGETAQELCMAQRATLCLERIQTNAGTRIMELYAESLYDLGVAFCRSGDLERGYEYKVSAQANLRRVPASSHLRLRVAVDVWRLRNHLIMDSKSWYPSAQRLEGLTMAFEEAYTSGCTIEAILALDALTEFYALAGNAEESLRVARLAVLLYKKELNQLTGLRMSILIAARLLMWTQHWEYALSLLPSQDQAKNCGVYDRDLLSYLAAFEARALRHPWSMRPRGDNRSIFPPLMVGRQLLAAVTAHDLGRRRAAYALLEEAVPAAEALGSAPTLWSAYSAAAEVTGDGRFRRQANDLARLLTA
jgi:hypothetical protein